MDSGDTATLTAKTEELSKVWYGIAESLYKSAPDGEPGAGGPQAGPAGAGPEAEASPGGGDAGDDGAVDADFQVVDDDDKEDK
jgi:molecular chaperone DnaK